jgi:hypothetical protein
MSILKKIIKDPIFLFILFAGIFYSMYHFATIQNQKQARQIAVQQSDVQLLEQAFEDSRNRKPSGNELDALVKNFVLDEIFFRQAVALGLDKSDLVAKRRLRQIMELMLDDYSTVYPTELQLQEYLTENPDKFRADPTISFVHKFYAFEEEKDALSSLEKLKKGANPRTITQSNLLMIPQQFENETKFVIKRVLGGEFTEPLFQQKVGEWTGPIKSTYGWHLVYIDKLNLGTTPDLNKIWDKVEQEWMFEHKAEMKDKQQELLLEMYDVQIEEIIN